MVAQDSILLTIKQSPGIPYPSLLSKISGNYSNMNSARAALSRTVKYGSALGLIEKRKTQLFLTEKGALKLGAEMKNKLLLQLNKMLKDENALENIEPIIEQLSTLTARAREDEDLLRLARTGFDFTIQDIQSISDKLEKKILHWNYLKGVLVHRIQAMKELDFMQHVEKKFNEKTIHSLEQLFKAQSLNEFFLEAAPEFLNYVQEKVPGERKGQYLVYSGEKFVLLFQFLLADQVSPRTESVNAAVLFGPIRLDVFQGRIMASGPYSKLTSLEA